MDKEKEYGSGHTARHPALVAVQRRLVTRTYLKLRLERTSFPSCKKLLTKCHLNDGSSKDRYEHPDCIECSEFDCTTVCCIDKCCKRFLNSASPTTATSSQKPKSRTKEFLKEALKYKWQGLFGFIIALIALGYALRADALARWTGKKDFREACFSDMVVTESICTVEFQLTV